MSTILYVHSHLVSQFSNLMRKLNNIYNQYVICCEIPSNMQHGSNIISIGKYDDTNPTMNGINAGIALHNLRNQGVEPKVIIIHVGDGLGAFVADVFPSATIIGYTEWYFTEKNINQVIKNALIRRELTMCSLCIAPTRNQKKQFPIEYQKKILVLHEGINDEVFRASQPAKEIRQERSNGSKYVITYVSRGLEPMRGFMEFIFGINMLLKSRQDIIVKIVGHDQVFYDDSTGISYKNLAIEALKDNNKYVEFLGILPQSQIKELFDDSDLHIYFTKDYALSWSLIESMTAGCIVLGSSTPPVKEFIVDETNGFLVNQSDPMTFRDKVSRILDLTNAEKTQIRQTAIKSVEHLGKDLCATRWGLLVNTLM